MTRHSDEVVFLRKEILCRDRLIAELRARLAHTDPKGLTVDVQAPQNSSLSPEAPMTMEEPTETEEYHGARRA